MKKTYGWRISTITVGILLICIAYAMNRKGVFYLDEMSGPLFIFSLAVLIISPFLFLISDKVFLKWLRFAGIWIGFSIFVIAATPESSEGMLSFGGPGKELVSIWLGTLLVIFSLAKIGWDWKKEKSLK